MNRKKKQCAKCKKKISLSNYNRHVDSCIGLNENSIYNCEVDSDGKYVCPHCGLKFSKHGIATHMWRVHGKGKEHNPNKGFEDNTRHAWNKDKPTYIDSFYSDDVKFKKFLDNKKDVLGENSIRRHLKKYLLVKNGNMCSICKGTEWMDKPIPLVCDHIDGHSDNNCVENVRLVCGNCDMQLPTYKSKNLGNGRKERRKQ